MAHTYRKSFFFRFEGKRNKPKLDTTFRFEVQMFSGLVLVLGFGGFWFCLFSPELPLPPSNVNLAGFWN